LPGVRSIGVPGRSECRYALDELGIVVEIGVAADRHLDGQTSDSATHPDDAHFHGLWCWARQRHAPDQAEQQFLLLLGPSRPLLQSAGGRVLGS